ncbi:hypothetical protein DY000_02061847 [Brassica cretica]|uniref:Uncharacterized protein n=1 Tax=Brassica cretica TaxID=69181 RepID=A0ABQ7AYL8_BRACR|nr:hypothetical protein DY000_02061847 [Brassica cretica]
MTQKNTEVAGMDTYFIPVRQARKGLTQNGQRGVTLQSNESTEMVGNKKLIGSISRGARQESMSEEIRVSNRFGGLNVEKDMEEQVEESGNREENKENENTTNIVSGGASKEIGKEFSFGKNGNRWNQQPARLGPKDKKISNRRGLNPSKTKLRNVGSMCGLVFGPISGESGLSARGKRLRVEKENVGRPGGVFAGDGELDRKEKNSGHRGVTLRSNESREMVGNKTLIGSKSRGARQESMSEEIRVSNRFGGLNVEEDMEEQVEESGNREENKENENTTNIVSGGASKETGREFSFGKNGNRGNQQPARLGPKDKKISNMRGPNPSKTKLRNVGPMRGLEMGS